MGDGIDFEAGNLSERQISISIPKKTTNGMAPSILKIITETEKIMTLENYNQWANCL